MRPEEEYVLQTLVNQFGGRFIDGEDPPDGYIIKDGKRIAVEVSMLVEQLQGPEGEAYSRLKDDSPAKGLASKIEADIQSEIPEGSHVFLVIGSPVVKIRKTKALICSTIIKMIQNGTSHIDDKFLGNDISISIFEGWSSEGPKVDYAISNRYSSANIGENAENLLRERINIKNKKRNLQPDTEEYWLALLNDYWLADEKSYRLAYKNLNLVHEFDKVLIVNGNRKAYMLK